MPEKEAAHKINNFITAPQVRVVGDNIEQPEVMSLRDALNKADEMGLDLVEISPKADPPVCRIVDYSKFLYQQKKKAKEIKSKIVKVVVKEIRFGPNTDDHDYDFKLKHAENFLKEGAKVKAYVFFRGRQIVFKDQGEILLLRFATDLEELANTPVMVVCAGAKSILDLGLTLEYLETHGVPVIGYGTKELPAFYTRKSGFEVDYRVDTPAELAAAFRASLDLGLRGGMLVTNPIPEEFAMDHEVINRAIDEAVAQANAQGIHGKATTPFLLAKVKDLTGGDSLESNIQLVYNNAVLGAKTACALAALKD